MEKCHKPPCQGGLNLLYYKSRQGNHPMNTFTKTTLATLTLLSATVAPALAGSNYLDHLGLRGSIRSTGIQLKYNPSECWEKSAMGWYWAAKNEMVICQENKRSVGVETTWTEEDLDTLRHEAQHLIQDCMDGSRQGALGAVYKDPIGLAQKVLGERGIRAIINGYSEASDHIKVMELEAFSVARMNVPVEQSEDIQKFCF